MSLKKERNKACGRGQLSPEIERKSRELLGYAISQQELRLMPYVQHCAINEILWLGYVMPVCGGICYAGESSI
ncbi:hypothetical protein D6T17_27095 [Salmonella enterica subsp. enterica serovar Oranienburg]|uniref:Uncharacterized protein n=1 Tax=Salmonella enterica TaxID=28901 RepID=A0A742LMW0_SALER|nr:hypothetical protein [Salmonella enterica subsp. enterica serovar Oranienburg]EEP9823104.1 hypothetical protein [Salmonella enterica subsp. diarizonae]HAF1420761.1 hypothetical protein [Salmonella enterica]EBY8947894.1 hypothetical protein [Salmonella enterica subsp. enterica serovar Oranienburg]HAF2207163.1 hypothetical protein [Salmonella enterica]